MKKEKDFSILSRAERRCVWISSTLVLLTLLVLVYVSLVSNVRTESQFFLVFIYLLEIIAGLSAAILSGTIIGSFKIKLEKHVSKTLRISLQATGGFAILVLVMMMSPRQQMSNVADAIIEAQVADCRSAVNSTEPAADAEGRCEALIRRYPNRPEPLFLLGRFTHRRSSLDPSKLAKARNYLQNAASLYGFKPGKPVEELVDDLSDYQLSVLRDVVYGAAVATADADLRAFGNHQETKDTRNIDPTKKAKAISSLKQANEYLRLARDLGNIGGGADYRIRTLGVTGVIKIYIAYLQNELNSEVLKNAEKTFRDAIKINPNYAVFQNYNIFVVTAHRAYTFSDQAALSAAKEALSKYIQALPKELENRENASFEGRMKNWLKRIVDNSRNDPFVVTRPIGGKAIAGGSIACFFTEHPKLKTELLNVFSD